MNYLNCKKAFDGIKNNHNQIDVIAIEVGTGIDELFIASSDPSEMNADLRLLHDNNYELAEQFLTSKNNDYSLWVLTDKGEITQVPQTYGK